MHDLDGALSCVGGGAREPLEQFGRAEPVVAVAVSCVDVQQTPAGRLNPVADLLDLLVSERRIDEDRVPLTEHEGRGDG